MIALVTDMMARYLRDQRGAATIELVFWIPFFLLMLFVIVDASVFYWRYTQMWDVSRTAARELSIGGIAQTSAAVDAYVKQRLGNKYQGELRDLGVSSSDPMIRVAATLETMSVFAFFDFFAGQPTVIVAEVRMRLEPF